MSKNILMYITDKTNNRTEKCVTDWYKWHDHLANYPIDIDYEIIEFSVSGRTYNERKESFRNKAIEIQSIMGTSADIDLSWYEITLVDDFLETNGRRYGLMEEFRTNGIV